MTIDFNDDGRTGILMKNYLVEAIDDFDGDVIKSAATPARRNLFDVDEDCKRLSTQRSDKFHSIVMKLLYVAKRGRPDILLQISFLCTRVSKSNENNWSKLRRV